MGMRIGNSAASTATQSVGTGAWQQRQQGVKDLVSALQAGDLSAAQKAYSGLSSNGDLTKGTGPLAQIGQALQGGNIAGAQQALQSWQGAHPHAHGHRRETGKPIEASTPPATGTPGALLDVTA